MRFLFLVSIIWVVYVYVGYLAVLIVLSHGKRLLRRQRQNKTSLLAMTKNGRLAATRMVAALPRAFRARSLRRQRRQGTPPRNDVMEVSLIIAAHNEEVVIRRKILEALHDLNYPKDKLEVIIASDASTDRTDEIVKGFLDQGVVLVRQRERKGKTGVQNLAVIQASGEILVFSDATTVYRSGVIRSLVRHFSDPMVGCVGGEEHFIKTADGSSLIADGKKEKNPSRKDIALEASFFWKYEKIIRQKESEFNSMIGVSGCVFAIRKELYEKLDDSLIEDFALPLKVAAKGYKVICENRAIAHEKAAANTGTELARKTRIVTGGVNVLWKMRHLLNPFRYPLLSFQLFSHKIARWFAPLFMVTLFGSNMYLINQSKFFLTVGLAQIIFYGLAIIGHCIRHFKYMPKVVKIVYHFCVMNFAAVFGILRFLKGERRVIWMPARQNNG